MASEKVYDFDSLTRPQQILLNEMVGGLSSLCNPLTMNALAMRGMAVRLLGTVQYVVPEDVRAQYGAWLKRQGTKK